MKTYFIGVDVGSSSARAGLFDENGFKIADAKSDTLLFRPKDDFVEQSSIDIWANVCTAVKNVIKKSQIDIKKIKGIGFDATCSLVVLDESFNPISISPTKNSAQNIIMWMDHRAIKQADFINSTKHPVLKYVGNCISPEMQLPKLLWLKQEMPETWSKAAYFFDLPDFLTWKATSSLNRSMCSTVCKWTYLGKENKWDESFFELIGLNELKINNFRAIGSHIETIATPLGTGLTESSAEDLGLLPGIAVGSSMIDAHAGGIGIIGASLDGKAINFDERLALIGGTSSCHMVLSSNERFINGIWGPYYSAMLPEYWLNEAGQSATGALIDHIITSHPCYLDALNLATSENKSIYQFLNETLLSLAGDESQISYLTKDIHILPYFHGNRSPRANPNLTGVITGLRMRQTIDDMALLYLATIQSIALGTRHIIEALNQGGYSINTIVACGGGTKNPVFLQEHANATHCDILLTLEDEAVLLGSAMIGAVAAKQYDNLQSAMLSMSRASKKIHPTNEKVIKFFDKKYTIFHLLYENDLIYKKIMGEN